MDARVVRCRHRGQADARPVIRLPGSLLGAGLLLAACSAQSRFAVDGSGTGSCILAMEFRAGDGGCVVENSADPPEGPWVYDAAGGEWAADGPSSKCSSGMRHSLLSTPPCTVADDGDYSLSFSHRYSFEGNGWDGGAVRISVNGGDFSIVPSASFTANGYTATLIGTHILRGEEGFNGDSVGYTAGQPITSTAVLGPLERGDTVIVQFAAAWDECSVGRVPNWVIQSLGLTPLNLRPSFKPHPGVAVFREGLDGRLRVRVLGSPPLELQWFLNGAPIPGATEAVLDVPRASRADEGVYRLTATNASGEASVEINGVVSNVATEHLPAWQWEGDGRPIVLEEAPSPGGPWSERGELGAGELTGVYVDFNPIENALFYRLRGEAAVQFSVVGTVPGWRYEEAAGTRHRVEYVDAVGGWFNWQTLVTLTLPESPYLFVDQTSLGSSPRVYRTTPVP